MEQIIIKNLWKSYDSLTVLKNVDLTLDRDQTYCLMSPSGTGKTTLFRILMGLEKADEGEIVWSASSGSCFGSDRDVSRPLRISTVFQEDRLCPTFSPLKNVLMVQKGKSSEFSLEEIRTTMCRLLPESYPLHAERCRTFLRCPALLRSPQPLLSCRLQEFQSPSW